MPRETDNLRAEIARLKARIAQDTLDVVRLEAMRDERERLQNEHELGMISRAMELGERFWSKVDRSGGPDACWLWLASKNRAGGYGKLTDDAGKTVYAHRKVLEAKLGRPLATGMQSMHACDNPACCNPAHLSEASPSDNYRDMMEKGRWTSAQVEAAQRRRRGNAVAAAKAKASGSPVALAITASQWKTLTAYAKRLKVSQPALSRYVSGSLECPAEVADQVRKDFGLADGSWPRPPRR